MIQDIAPKKFYNQYKAVRPEDGDRVLCFRGEQVGIFREDDESLRLPRRSDFREDDESFRYLFSIDEDRYFLFLGKMPDGMRTEAVRGLRQQTSLDICFAAATGFHLYVWYRDNHYCGRCGSELKHDAHARMLKCPDCGLEVYPKIAPAVIVAVYDGDRLLLTKYSDRAYKLYALIAGFTEIGETAEQTVYREVEEEVGLKVKNVRYWGEQPWGTDQNLLLGFTAELDGSDEIRLDEDELAVAEWFHRDEIPVGDDHISLTRAMVEAFKKGEF